MNKTVKFTIAGSLILGAAMILLALPVSRAITPQQSRTLTVVQNKNAPVTVTSLMLGDTNIAPGARFNTSETWADDLKITVSNDSEEPISFILVSAAIDDANARNTSAVSAYYGFGKEEGGTELLAPGQTVVLHKIGKTSGDPQTSGLIRVTPARVRWNGDDSREWYYGFEMYRDPNRPGVYNRVPAHE
jgi:hypothetical protein